MANGLLDFIGTPEGQGLLSMAFGGLAGARRGAPLNAIGNAGLSGLAGYANAQERQADLAQRTQMSQLRDMQIAAAKRAAQDDADVRTLAGQYYNPGKTTEQVFSTPGQPGPTVERAAVQSASAPTFDTNGFVGALFAKNPTLGLQYQQAFAKETPFNKVDAKDFTPESIAKFATTRNYGDLVPRVKMEVAPSGQAYNPYNVKEGSVFADPNKPFSVGPNGQFTPNVPYQQFEINKSKAGATNVKIENKTGESIAGQVGPMVRDTWTAANGAIQTADSANRLIQAVDSGNLYAGPLANGRLTMAQVGSTLGVGGKDEQEKIANTRQAVTALANLTLQGRKQMTGQGAITESEGKLAERALSGDISMTPGELKQLANAARRSARFTYDLHQSQLNAMRQDPNLLGLSKFYGTPAFPGMPASNNQPGAFVDFGSMR